MPLPGGHSRRGTWWSRLFGGGDAATRHHRARSPRRCRDALGSVPVPGNPGWRTWEAELTSTQPRARRSSRAAARRRPGRGRLWSAADARALGERDRFPARRRRYRRRVLPDVRQRRLRRPPLRPQGQVRPGHRPARRAGRPACHRDRRPLRVQSRPRRAGRPLGRSSAAPRPISGGRAPNWSSRCRRGSPAAPSSPSTSPTTAFRRRCATRPSARAVSCTPPTGRSPWASRSRPAPGSRSTTTPGTRRPTRIEITVPDGLEALSNGVPQGTSHGQRLDHLELGRAHADGELPEHAGDRRLPR